MDETFYVSVDSLKQKENHQLFFCDFSNEMKMNNKLIQNVKLYIYLKSWAYQPNELAVG
jgi:hypothetical protein